MSGASREQRATFASFIAGGLVTVHGSDVAAIAQKSVAIADAIIAEVDKPEEHPEPKKETAKSEKKDEKKEPAK